MWLLFRESSPRPCGCIGLNTNLIYMRKPDQFYFYAWLIQFIAKKEAGVTLEEINQQWLRNEMNDGAELTRHSFRRYKNDIADKFAIDIECDRKTNKYYIGNPQVLRGSSVQRWMLSTLSVSNIISRSLFLQDRIILENIPIKGEMLRLIIDAMKQKLQIAFSYKKYRDAIPSQRLITPCCIKLFRQRWYVIAYNPTTKPIFKAFAFDRISNLKLTDKSFELPAGFQAERIFEEAYGIFFGDEEAKQRIIIRAFGDERFYMRDLPLHHSQEALEEGNGYTDYQFHLRPYADFVAELLSKGDRIEVLSPESLRERMREEHLKAAKRYEK